MGLSHIRRLKRGERELPLPEVPVARLPIAQVLSAPVAPLHVGGTIDLKNMRLKVHEDVVTDSHVIDLSKLR